jgi:hypothetical protein
MLLDTSEREQAGHGLMRPAQIILAVLFALGIGFAPAGAQAAGPACNPNVVAGNPCVTVGQTAMDCGGQNVLACLYPKGQTTGQRWYIAGTDSIPSCTNVGQVLQFNGSTFICQAKTYPTCPDGQAMTSDGTNVTCATVVVAAPTPDPGPTAPPTTTYTTLGTNNCPVGSTQYMNVNGVLIMETCTPTGYAPVTSE